MEKIKGTLILLTGATLIALVITAVVIGRKGPSNSIRGLIIMTVLFLLTGLAIGLTIALFFKSSYNMTIILSVIGLSIGLLGWLLLKYTTDIALAGGIFITWLICLSCSIVFCLVNGLSYLMSERDLSSAI